MRVNTEMQDIDRLATRANQLDLLERLADDLAHEIKNPLHSMVINLEVLKRRVSRCGAEEAPELLRYVGILGTELERVNRRVEMLLRVSRPERASGPIAPDEVIEELMELLRLESMHKGVKINWVSEAPPLPVDASRALLRQTVLNLVFHALDSALPGETLTIRTRSQNDRMRISLEGVSSLPGLDRRSVENSVVDEGAVNESATLQVSMIRALSDAVGGSLDWIPPADGAAGGSGGALALFLPLAPR